MTGANQGTGFAIAKAFLSEGASVGAHHYRDEAGAKNLFQFSKAGQCALFQANFADDKEVVDLWRAFSKWSKGKIDVLVNNAAFLGSSESDWDLVFQVNLKAPVTLMKLAFPLMIKRKSGRIINMSSISVKIGGNLGTERYAASKAALEAVTKAYAQSGRKLGVSANIVRPGITDSPLHRQMAKQNSFFRNNKFISPEEIARAVVELAQSAKNNEIIEVGI